MINGSTQTTGAGYLTAAEHVSQNSAPSNPCAVWRCLACFAQCTSEELFFMLSCKGGVMYESDRCFFCNLQLERNYIDISLWTWWTSFGRRIHWSYFVIFLVQLYGSVIFIGTLCCLVFNFLSSYSAWKYPRVVRYIIAWNISLCFDIGSIVNYLSTYVT